MTKTTKRFTAHDNLIIQVIKKQAGSLGKAILEGVMNSVDAGASICEITLTSDKLEIKDDGRGITEQSVIDEFFAKFGTPHELGEDGHSVDAKYAYYRMGRGQLFAFGHSNWRTGPYELVVDIDKKGLDFEQIIHKQNFEGCRITTTLTERLSATDIVYHTEDVVKYCKYVDIPVTLNGNQINTPPQFCKWTEETEDAFIKISESGYRGVDFYQQGVFVQNLPAYHIGASGIIVTKEPVALNFARNDVMRSDPRFKRIIARFKKDVEKKIKAKRVLTEDERVSLLRALAAGEQTWKENTTAKVFKDTSGRTWSINTLRRLPGTDEIIAQPDTKIGYSFAPLNDRRADQVMQSHKGLVLDVELMDVLDYDPDAFFEEIDWSLNNGFKFVALGELAKASKTTFRLIEDKNRTLIEERVLRALESAQRHMTSVKEQLTGEKTDFWKHLRALRLGVSDHAEAWTDGATYIAFNRDFIKRVGTSGAGFVNLTNTLCHELCHDCDDTEDHGHDMEFYKLFHDILHHDGCGGDVATQAHRDYVQLVENAARGVTKQKRLKEAKKQTHAANEAMLAAEDACV